MKKNLLLKLLLCMLLACITAFSFTACGKGNDGENSDSGSQDGNNANVSASVVMDGLKYNVSNGSATIKGVENSEGVETVFIPAKISYQGNDFAVNSIESGVFSKCSLLKEINVDEQNASYKSIDGNLYSKDGNSLVQYAAGNEETEFTIPAGVVNLEDYAFRYNGNLTSIVIPDSVKTIGYGSFYECDNLVEVTLSSNLETIGERAFRGCKLIENLVIPNTVKSVGYFAFDGCASLKYFEKEGLNYLGNETNNYLYLVGAADTSIEEVAIDENCNLIGYWAFRNCDKIKSVVIPGNVTVVGRAAFSKCSSLASVDLPDSLTTIDNSAFLYCTSLASIKIPSNVTTIEASAFRDCTSLTQITIGESVKTIGISAFYNCSALTVYSQAKSKPFGWNTNWNNSKCPVVWNCENNNLADDGFVYAVLDDIRYALKEEVKEDETVYVATVARQSTDSMAGNIPETVTYNEKSYTVKAIVASAFSGCANLENVSIPNTIETVGVNAFYGCESLKFNEILDAENEVNSLKYLGNEANEYFYLVGAVLGVEEAVEKKMSVVNVNENCKIIAAMAFKDYTTITTINVPESVTSVGSDAFTGCGITSAVVPGIAITFVPQASLQTLVDDGKLTEPITDIKTGESYNLNRCVMVKYNNMTDVVDTLLDTNCPS